MAKSIFGKSSFTLGEISPRVFGRWDEAKPIYRDGVASLQNFMILQAGGVFFRPGTQYIATAGQSSNPVRLEPFRYSITQQYILELGNQYIQFYANSGQVQSGGNPVVITTPYLQADLFNLQFANKADVLYIANNNYQPYKLIRTSSNSFIFLPVQFQRGPFMSLNVGNVTLTPSAATGSGITLTATIPAWASSTQYLPGSYVTNGGNSYYCRVQNTSSGSFSTDLAAGYWIQQNFFRSGHVGSQWLVGTAASSGESGGGTNGVILITSVSSGTVAVGNVMLEPNGTAGNLNTTSATKVWAEGAWSNDRGWPSSVTFHENRLVFGGTTAQPSAFWGSQTGAYENFDTGSASDSDSYSFTILSDVVLGIRWLQSNIALKIGTSQGTVTAADGSTSTGITPASPPQITIDTDYAVMLAQVDRIGGYNFYVQSNTYQLRQLIYNFYVNRDQSEDMTLLADHILRDGGGAVQISRQQSPNDRIWVIRADGQMAVLVRNVEQQITGWCRLIPGTSSGGQGAFESVAIIPQDGGDDQIWVSVRRVINGNTVRFIELFTNELFQYYYQPCRLDASLSIDNPITITGISNANPGVITAAAHGLSNGNRVKIDNVNGMTYNTFDANGNAIVGSLNMNQYLVANATTNTFTLTDLSGNAINTTSWSMYLSGGQARKMFTTFSGLSYLNGETVTVVTDGSLPAAQQTFLVSGGSITLPNYAAVVKVGLPYQGILQFLPLGEQSGGYISQTKNRKIYKPVAKFWASAGGQFGYPITNVYPIIYPNQTPNIQPSQFAGLYTGDYELDLESFFDKQWSPYVVQNYPVPLMILSLVFRSDIEEDK